MLQQELSRMREAEVQGRLALVVDPELDQPLTELGFVSGIAIDGGVVTVGFRLPTYWCSPNFAFLMASDIRDRVSELPWVSQVRVDLTDHFASVEITEGVNTRRPFTETFPGLATEELEELRAKFRVKAFIARQERLLRHLLNLGLADEQIARVTLSELHTLVEQKQDEAGCNLLDRYVAIRIERGFAVAPEQLAFTAVDGQPVDPVGFRSYLRTARSVRLNMEFNSSLCRGLLQTRYSLASEGETCGSPRPEAQPPDSPREGRVSA
jgi:metal-sulfur cluster biosynthetic enzyme